MADEVGRPPIWAVTTLAGANYRSFEEVIDKHAAENAVMRNTLRDSLGTWVDEDLETAVERHDISQRVLLGAAARCHRAVENQFPELL